MKKSGVGTRGHSVSIVVLGEKDHGKSTFLGRLLHETGSIPPDRVRDARVAARKLGKKFEWSHLLDSFRYERESEMTLDTTRAMVRTKTSLYEFIDVPGHKELAKNMASGVSHAQHAVLIIAADKGIRPQTIRHVRIAKLLGIEDVLVAVNKCDKIDYSQKRFQIIAKLVRTMLAREGFGRARVIPVVADRGENLVKTSSALSWFKGPTLLTAVKMKFRPVRIRNTDIAKLLVQDRYNGSRIIGRVEKGVLTAGDLLRLFPRGERFRIKKISSGGRDTEEARAGNAVELILTPSPQQVKRGDVLIAGELPLTSLEALCECVFFEAPRRQMLLESGFRNFSARSHSLIKRKTHSVIKVRITFEEPVSLHSGFVVKRKSGKIIGFGRIQRLLPKQKL